MILYGLLIGWVSEALIAGIFSRGEGELQRAPYFAYFCLIVVAGAASGIAWLGSVDAVLGGYLWGPVVTSVLSLIVIGYFYGVIAMASPRENGTVLPAIGFGMLSFGFEALDQEDRSQYGPQ